MADRAVGTVTPVQLEGLDQVDGLVGVRKSHGSNNIHFTTKLFHMAATSFTSTLQVLTR
ncbi:hypothetical protein [Nocardia arthritidis]|uniref:Uncharacterized protein n=1 Tax=Nocardia arthritidis TaxID=228602 RepID=A0A6G9YIA8_9NOCA|nr:hypothetical protein [Nocardia arthritidis]QIS12797.1 hypothetical protein F5544_24710 [Nocardia arthritidis]